MAKAKKVPVPKTQKPRAKETTQEKEKQKKVVVTKKVFVTHTDSEYEITFFDGVAKTCQCILSVSGTVPTFEPYEIDPKQLKLNIDLKLWKEK